MSAPAIRPARADEHELVSALALRSKAHWGYSSEFLEACRAELTYSADDCASGRMWVAVSDAVIVGFSLLTGTPPTGELNALFVDPDVIGTGVGRLLLIRTLRAATELGFTRLTLDSDPQAEPFYLRFGARRMGTTPSGSIVGRELPKLQFDLIDL